MSFKILFLIAVFTPFLLIAAGVIARGPKREPRTRNFDPGEDLFVPAVSGDQLGEPVASRPPAFVALDPQHDELAEEVRKDDRAVAGHCHRFDAWQPRSRRCGAEKCHSTPHGPDNSCGPAT